MTKALVLLAAAILLFAAFLVAHVAAIWVTVRSDVEPRWKWLSLVPVLTPVAAWKAKRRGATIAWGLFLVGYGVVRLVGG
ncbi:MAG: hypothetical protein H6723_19445 [Sandaracinus sp.]|nr:hypothetical protein [Sandaracinus sp.]